MMHTLAIHLSGMVPLLSVFLDATTDAFKTQMQNAANETVTVLTFAIPIIATFRVGYRFAKSEGEASLSLLVFEVLGIILLSFVIGSLLHVLIDNGPFFK